VGMDKLEALKVKLQDFADDRDWDQFHSPKNLSMALSVEASELVECLTEEQSKNLNFKQYQAALMKWPCASVFIAPSQ
jgi:dCTP diphosphatase